MQQIRFNGEYRTPGKIVCVGRNYVEHILELGNEVPDEPVLFIKPNSAIADEIVLRAEACRFEAEITLLMHHGVCAGVGLGLDLTLIEVQKQLIAKGLPWEKCKGFNGSAVFSPFVPVDSVEGLRLELWVNGKLQQSGGVALMIYPPEQLLPEIARYFALQDDDLVMTGTPQGVAQLRPGDRLEGKILDPNGNVLIGQSWVVQ